MSKKSKFKPVITRVKLNPEQAVLSCDCYVYGYTNGPDSGSCFGSANTSVCVYSDPKNTFFDRARLSSTASS